MSTIAFDYSDSLPVRHSTGIRWILILVIGLALVAGVFWVAGLSSPKVNSLHSVVAVPVPVVPVAAAQVQLAVTVTPAPVVVAVPVPTPPAH